MLLGLVDQRGVGLIPYSDVFLFQIYNNQWEYTTGEKSKIYPCAEMRITILTFSSYCIYMALPDISAPFFRTVRDWSEIIKTSSLLCPVVLWGVLRQQNIGAVSEEQRG